MIKQYNPEITETRSPTARHKDSMVFADYESIEKRILAHMTQEQPKDFVGELVYDVMEDGVRYRIEKVPTPYITSGYARYYRLWRDNEPARGGQWHSNIPSAIRRIDYETTGSWARKVGVLEGQVGYLEPRLHEAQEEAAKLKKLLKSNRSGGAKLNWSPGHSEDGSAGTNAKATISTPSHSEKIVIYGATLAEAEATRDSILESRHAIEAMRTALAAAGIEQPSPAAGIEQPSPAAAGTFTLGGGAVPPGWGRKPGETA